MIPPPPPAYWFHQRWDDCIPSAVDVIVGYKTGVWHSETTADTLAEKLQVVPGVPVYTPGHGAYFNGIPVLLAHYRIASKQASISDATLARLVKAGHGVIAAVNAETLWGTGSGTVDHAVVVDAVDTGSGTVTLTDTGIPGGRTEVVSTSVFNQAFSASGYVAYWTTR